MKRSLPTAVRRALVLAAVAGSLVLGVVTIRAAADWTAASAPLAAPPVTVEGLAGQLAAERGRGAELQARLNQVAAHAGELEAALAAANARIDEDGAAARALTARIKAAQGKLAALNRQIATARAAARAAASRPAVVVRQVTAASVGTAPATEPRDDD